MTLYDHRGEPLPVYRLGFVPTPTARPDAPGGAEAIARETVPHSEEEAEVCRRA